jgi:myosin heavy chain 9/10/11/14
MQYAEMKAAIEAYQQKEQMYQQKLEAAEIARATAARAEATGKRLVRTKNWVLTSCS